MSELSDDCFHSAHSKCRGTDCSCACHRAEKLALENESLRSRIAGLERGLEEVCNAAGEWHSEVIKVEGVEAFPNRLTDAVMKARGFLAEAESRSLRIQPGDEALSGRPRDRPGAVASEGGGSGQGPGQEADAAARPDEVASEPPAPANPAKPIRTKAKLCRCGRPTYASRLGLASARFCRRCALNVGLCTCPKVRHRPKPKGAD